MKLWLLPAEPVVRNCYLAIILFVLVAIAGFSVADSLAPAGRRLAKVTGVDPPGYFGVSHALLFHQDFNLADEYAHVKPDDSPWSRVRKETGHPGSYWAVGYSIVAMPFLAMGTLADEIAGHPADGYSHFAILGYCLANLVLTGVGLLALLTFLRDIGSLWEIAAPRAAILGLFVTFATFFGTNVGYYAISPMSHAATFCDVALFLAVWFRVRNRLDIASWILLGLLGGLLSISRWQDIFFVGGPILFDLAGGRAGVLPRLKSRLVYAVTISLCWIPQLIEWKYIFGRPAPPPLGPGYFAFPPQFILEILFSTRSGWFLWTPLVFLGICGLVIAAFGRFRLVMPWLVVLAMEIFFVGTLVTWHGGEGFSIRYLTSSAPVIALGLMALLCSLQGIRRRLAMLAIGLCCLIAVDSAIQFRLDLLPHDDRMTAREFFTDRFHPLEVRHRKIAAKQALAFLEEGEKAQALQAVQGIQNYGSDRDVLESLSKVDRANGREMEAQEAERKLKVLMASRLF